MARKDLLHETIAVYDKLGARYADRIAHVRLPQLNELTGVLTPGARVLDVGCAAGRDSAILQGAGLEVVGIDLSDELLRLARERVPGVEFQHMDARSLNLENDSFDGVWAWAVLLNLERPEILGVLREFWRVMKPDGICLISVKEGEGERFVNEPLVDDMKRRETYFQESELGHLLSSSRFRLIRTQICDDLLARSATKWLTAFAKK